MRADGHELVYSGKADDPKPKSFEHHRKKYDCSPTVSPTLPCHLHNDKQKFQTISRKERVAEMLKHFCSFWSLVLETEGNQWQTANWHGEPMTCLFLRPTTNDWLFFMLLYNISASFKKLGICLDMDILHESRNKCKRTQEKTFSPQTTNSSINARKINGDKNARITQQCDRHGKVRGTV